MGSVLNTLKKHALVGLFALSGLAATGQTQPQQQSDKKLSALKNTEFLFLLKSYHTNQELDFKETNFPSLLVKQQFTPHFSGIGGVYPGSNYKLNPLGGFNVQTKPIEIISDEKMSVQFGFTAGMALYHKKYRYDTSYTKVNIPIPADGKTPKNKKKHGRNIQYYRMQTYDSLCDCTHDEIIEITRRIKPHGEGKFVPQFAAFPTVMLNVFKGNGLFLLGTYGPGLGQGDSWGGIFAGGIRTSPYYWFNKD
jgi:hypothetical protein